MVNFKWDPESLHRWQEPEEIEQAHGVQEQNATATAETTVDTENERRDK